jgi:hypothetical protein
MIDEGVLEEMFDIVGIDKTELYDALRELGTRYMRFPTYRMLWTPEMPVTCRCYTVSEGIFRYLAPRGTQPRILQNSLGTHRHLWYPHLRDVSWPAKYIIDKNYILIDLTAEQEGEFDYLNSRYQNFIANCGISKGAQELARLMGWI